MKGIVAVNLSVSGTSTTPTGAANDAAYHLAKSTFRCALTKRLRSSFPPHSNALEVDHVELLGDAVPSTLMFDVTAAEFLRVLAGTGCLDDFLARLIRPALAETEGLELKDARIVVVARGFDIASEARSYKGVVSFGRSLAGRSIGERDCLDEAVVGVQDVAVVRHRLR